MITLSNKASGTADGVSKQVAKRYKGTEYTATRPQLPMLSHLGDIAGQTTTVHLTDA